MLALQVQKKAQTSSSERTSTTCFTSIQGSLFVFIDISTPLSTEEKFGGIEHLECLGILVGQFMSPFYGIDHNVQPTKGIFHFIVEAQVALPEHDGKRHILGVFIEVTQGVETSFTLGIVHELGMRMIVVCAVGDGNESRST
jgi:hypothetical protein